MVLGGRMERSYAPRECSVGLRTWHCELVTSLWRLSLASVSILRGSGRRRCIIFVVL